eukprot:SAG22_NODE_836_length_6913_cov_4.894188_2_plen_277_part_00
MLPKENEVDGWHMFETPAEMQPLFEYLDGRGHRESQLRGKLQEVVYAMLQSVVARTEKAYLERAQGAETVEAVVESICSALEEVAEADALRQDGVGLGQEALTHEGISEPAAPESTYGAAERLLGSYYLGAVVAEDDEGQQALAFSDTEALILVDDMDGRVVWANFGGQDARVKSWWPATMVPLCAEVPANVLKAGTSMEKRRLAKQRGGSSGGGPAADGEDEQEELPMHQKLVLVQYMGTEEYGWVEREDLVSFWEVRQCLSSSILTAFPCVSPD